MSTALAIAGVTAVLRDMLNDGLINHNVSGVIGTTVTVSALPPDRVPINGVENTQINLFMHQVTPNLGWRNEALPSRDSAGMQRLSNPPLALDLHYLVSAYGAEDLHTEILLGYAMQLFHENAVLSRADINTALSPSPNVGVVLPPALRALADCGLADQLEHIRISPSSMNTEEMSRLWSALQANYRPTAAYHVSVVLIESTRRVRSPLPVLNRDITVQPSMLPPLPMLQQITPLNSQPVARMDESIDLVGSHLDGTSRQAQLINQRFEVDEMLAASGTSTNGLMQFTIPAARAADFPVGFYQVAASLIKTGEAERRTTNRLGLVLAPHILGLPFSTSRDGAGNAAFTLNFQPQLREGQTVSLVLGQQEVAPLSFVAPTSTLNFVVENAPLGNHLARLRIDGIDSVIINRGTSPPAFFNHRITIT